LSEEEVLEEPRERRAADACTLTALGSAAVGIVLGALLRFLASDRMGMSPSQARPTAVTALTAAIVAALAARSVGNPAYVPAICLVVALVAILALALAWLTIPL